jgi:glucose-6-phosphate 1-dehydrogenase
MSAEARTLLILGASGDLAARLLLPGLGGLLGSGEVEDLELVGSGRDEMDDETWRRRVADAFAAGGGSGPAVDAVAASTRYVKADVADPEEFRALLDACEPPVVVYFALPPAVTERACQALREIGAPEGTRLAMEKPFGHDAASAAALNELLTAIVPEDRIHRVDHFLGISTVLNIAGVRFANRIFEPVLNAEHVASVSIVFDESLGLEGRAGYYDGAGALVDMIQSHLLQVLALVAMEAPATLQARDLRGTRAQALRATHVWDDDPVRFSRRARYSAGRVGDRDLPAYADEEGVDPDRKTETYAEIVLAVDTWRWAGVPFTLRSGKAIGNPRTEVTIEFKDPPRLPTGFTGYPGPDRLRLGISPGAGSILLEVNLNGAGDPAEIDRATFETHFGAGELHEYGEVLRRILAGDPVLSVRGDVAVDCWRIVDPVVEAWRRDEVPLEEYPAGSDGPAGVVG